MSNRDLIAERLKAMNEGKNALKQDKPNVVQNIATGEDEKPDFEKMAAILATQKEGQQKSVNEEYQKDTLYIRRDLFNALQALCSVPGDKKHHVNAAYEMYLTKVYKDLNIDLSSMNVVPSGETIRITKPRKNK